MFLSSTINHEFRSLVSGRDVMLKFDTNFVLWILILENLSIGVVYNQRSSCVTSPYKPVFYQQTKQFCLNCSGRSKFSKIRLAYYLVRCKLFQFFHYYEVQSPSLNETKPQLPTPNCRLLQPVCFIYVYVLLFPNG